MPVRFRIEDPALAQLLRRIEHTVRRAGGRTWLVGGSADLAPSNNTFLKGYAKILKSLVYLA